MPANVSFGTVTFPNFVSTINPSGAMIPASGPAKTGVWTFSPST